MMTIELTPEYLTSQGLNKTFLKRFWEKVNKNGAIPAHCPELGPCWIWTGSGPNGYGQIGSGRKLHFQAHVASWIIHIGPLPDGVCVLHKCDTRKCIRPEHLFAGSILDNNADMVSKGRQCRGIGKPLAKMTDETVVELRRRVANGEKLYKAASAFGITPATACQIVNRKTWRHVV